MPRASRGALARRLGLLALGLLGVAAIGAGPLDLPSEGRSLYHGLASAGQACASCHGLSGDGGSEGGTAIRPFRACSPKRALSRPATLADADVGPGRRPGGRWPDDAALRARSRSMPVALALSGVSGIEPSARHRFREDRRSNSAHAGDALAEAVARRPRESIFRNQSGRRTLCRRIVLEEGPGPAAFLISLAPAGPLEGATAIRMALREAASIRRRAESRRRSRTKRRR